jgi:glycosyltransferase involved in cell wall biosynthesis
MNIGLDARALQSAEPTGVGAYAREFFRAIRARARADGHTVTLFFNAYKTLPADAECPPEDARIVRLRYPNICWNAGTALAGRPHIDRVIERRTGERLDAFFSPNLHFTAVSPRVTYILTIHDLSFEFFPDCFSRKQRLWHRAVRPREQCRRANVIFVPSGATKRDVVDYYGIPADRVRIIPLAASVQFVPPTAEERNAVRRAYGLPERYLLFVGAIEPRKNVDGLIDAYLLWKKTYPRESDGWQLILAGPAGWRADELLAAGRGDASVRAIGYVPDKWKSALYAQASLFVYPSFYEGFGLPVLEAFAAGVPVIASDRSSLPEVCGASAHLVNPYDIGEIARAFHTLANDANLRERYRAAGKSRAANYSWNSAATAFFSLL